jgi:hypothetical protein
MHRSGARSRVCSSAALVAWVVLSSACASDDQFERVAFSAFWAGAARESAGPITTLTPQGWSVVLDAAYLSFGPVYARNARPDASTSEENGRVVAQVLSIHTVDALSPDRVPASVQGLGITEPALSGEVRLAGATSGPIADAQGSRYAVAYVRGVASKDGAVVPFEGFLDFGPPPDAQAYQWFTNHRVLKIPLGFVASEGGELEVRVDPTHWLDRVDFSLNLSDDGTQRFRTPALQVALRSGIAAPIGVYTWTWEEGE